MTLPEALKQIAAYKEFVDEVKSMELMFIQRYDLSKLLSSLDEALK